MNHCLQWFIMHLLDIVEACDEDDICTMDVTVTAYQKNDTWRLHFDDEFINAFMGNIDAGEYSEEICRRIEGLDYQQEEKMNEWKDEFTDRMERWAEKFME